MKNKLRHVTPELNGSSAASGCITLVNPGSTIEHFSFYYVFSLKMKNAIKIVPIAQFSKKIYLTHHF